MSADLQAARLMMHHAAWLSDTQGPTPTTLAALYRAKYLVGEVVAGPPRTVTLGGAHALFKTSRWNGCFETVLAAPIQFPPRDFCLASLGVMELELDPGHPATVTASAVGRGPVMRPAYISPWPLGRTTWASFPYVLINALAIYFCCGHRARD